MRNVILYIATSLDGFIAKKDGGLDWLETFPHPKKEDYGYVKLLNRIDTTLMGKNTFDFVAQYEGPFPYPNSTNYVFSNSDIESDLPIQIISGDAVAFLKDLKQLPGKDIWLIGGGRLNASFANAGLIDEIIITQIPVYLGEGIPVFQPLTSTLNLTLIQSKTYDNGVQLLTLQTEKQH
jgi:dihydrofolate reductase